MTIHLWVSMDSLGIHNMSYELESQKKGTWVFIAKLTLLNVQCQSSLFKAKQNSLDTCIMFHNIMVSSMDKDIINLAYNSIQVLQGGWHGELKYFMCGTSSKRQGGQQFWVLIQRNLPLLVSNLLNTLLSPSLTRLSSTEPMGWVLHYITLLFQWCKPGLHQSIHSH